MLYPRGHEGMAVGMVTEFLRLCADDQQFSRHRVILTTHEYRDLLHALDIGRIYYLRIHSSMGQAHSLIGYSSVRWLAQRVITMT